MSALGGELYRIKLEKPYSTKGRYDGPSWAWQFPQYNCAAFGSPDYYSYQFMDDHYIAGVRRGMKGKLYVLFLGQGHRRDKVDLWRGYAGRRAG